MHEVKKGTGFYGEAVYVHPDFLSQGGAVIKHGLGGLSGLQMYGGFEDKRNMVALKETGHDEAHKITKPYKERSRLGPLCKWAVMRCKESGFGEFLSVFGLDRVTRAQQAKDKLMFLDMVDSRKWSGIHAEARLRFKQLFLSFYRKWLEQRGVVAWVIR